MESLSIVVLNWRDLHNPAAGGAELYIHELARRWVKTGHTVTLLTSQFEGAAAEDTLDGVKIQRQGSRYTVYRRARQTYLESFRGRADAVIDCVNTIPFFTPKFVTGRTPLFALIFQLAREGWFYETPWPIAVVGRYVLEDHWLRLYRAVSTFAISDSTKQDLLALGFRRVHVIRPGAPVRSGTPAVPKESAPTLLYVGRLKEYKLPHHAVEAFRRVRSQIPEAQLWLVGDGYMRDRLVRGAPPRVTVFGHASEAQKLALMQRAHVLLCPSVREGWGLVVTEANSLGLPAVGYDVPGLRDSIRNGETGFLVPANNPEAMAQAAIELLSDRVLLDRTSQAALAWAGSLSWDAGAREMLDLIAKEGDPSSRASTHVQTVADGMPPEG